MTATGLLAGNRMSLVRGGQLIFQNFNIAMAAGEAVHLTGPNGAGKTSLLRLFAGALTLEKGAFSIADTTDVFFLPADDRSITGQRSVFSFLSFWAKLWEVEAKNISCALEQAGIAALHGQPLGHLSAGQKRRLHWARLCLQQHTARPARLWLLDEPFKGLDETGLTLCGLAIAQHLAGGGAALIASQEALPAIAHRVVPLKNGAA